MKLSIIFVLAILIVGQEAWAKDQPIDLSKSPQRQVTIPPGFELESSPQTGLQPQRQVEIVSLISDVVNGKAAVRPSMIPPEIFDRIYFVEKWTQAHMADLEKEQKGIPPFTLEEIQALRLMFYAGQLTGMRDALYIVGILPESIYSLNPLFKNYGVMDAEILQLAIKADHMRLITAMLLLLNYKESNPIPPGDIVQVTSVK